MFLCASLIGSAFFLPVVIACNNPFNPVLVGERNIAVDVINELLSKLQRRVSLFQIELNLSDNSYSYLIVMLFP